jgi:transcriptional regulator with XRE-family HTH domain
MPTWTWVDSGNAEELGLRAIGEAIYRRRVRYRLTQHQLAMRTGVTQSTISRLENARLRTMKIGTLARIMYTLELGGQAFFPLDGPPASRRLPGEPA